MIIVGANYWKDAAGKEIDLGACVILKDNEILAGIAEERITRKKHAGGFKNSLHYLLKELGIKIHQVDFFAISFYAHPIPPHKDVIKEIVATLGLVGCPEKLSIVPSHHLSHAYHSYFLSPFEEAVIINMDNEGSILNSISSTKDLMSINSFERHSSYLGSQNKVELIDRDLCKPGELAFGKAYSLFTKHLGLGNYLDAGKTMGLSSYGDASEFNEIDLWDIDKEGRLISNLKTGNSFQDIVMLFLKNNYSLPRANTGSDYTNPVYANLAKYIQNQLNKWCTKKVEYLADRFGIQNFCLGGGVALNCIVNSFIEKELRLNVFTPPAPSDTGQAFGNAICCYINKLGQLPQNKIRFGEFTFLGPEIKSSVFSDALSSLDKSKWELSKEKDINLLIARIVSMGGIVGLFSGKSEFGERALGNRSIIADPRNPNNKDLINEKKGREKFRPIAPSILEKYVNDFFVCPKRLLLYYMSGIGYVKNEEIRNLIPSAIHVDGTARIQLVGKINSPVFYDIINKFHNLTNIPLLLNTSFNLAGEPLVESPCEALHTAERMNLDALLLGQYLLIKKH
jgi:carbamoyltransferase